MTTARWALAVGAAFVACPSACFLLTIDESRIDSASGDAASADESSTSEAGADAGGVTPWIPCAQRVSSAAHFCDDFDDPGQVVTRKWSYASLAHGGVLDVGVLALSPPAAAGAYLPPVDASASTYVTAEMGLRPVPRASSAITLAFSLRLGAEPWSGNVGTTTNLVLANVLLAPCPATNGGVRGVELIVSGTRRLRLSLRCLTGTDYATFDLSETLDDLLAPPSDGGAARWTRFEIRLAREPCPSTSAPSLSASVRAEAKPVGCSALTFDPFTALDGLTATIGAATNGPTRGPLEIDYDDVTFDQE